MKERLPQFEQLNKKEITYDAFAILLAAHGVLTGDMAEMGVSLILMRLGENKSYIKPVKKGVESK